MTTKQYFYRDPLAAAWMEKHFSATFYYPFDEGAPDDAAEVDGDVAYEADCGWGKAKERRYYIHPNSFDLLKPLMGDILYTSNGSGYSLEELRAESRAHHVAPILIERGGQIIHRHGIAFHWPECEEV